MYSDVELQQGLGTSLHVFDFNFIILSGSSLQCIFPFCTGVFSPIINDFFAIHIHTVAVISLYG